MIVRARAPLRMSFGGGGTDVPPYPQKFGGAVISTTIDKYAYCTVSERPQSFVFKSTDLELSETYPDLQSLQYDGTLDLPKAVVKTICPNDARRFELSLFSEAPPGSGLGSSSALMVAIIRAVADFLGLQESNHSIAELAYNLERVQLRIKGGYQDQYACTFGGFNFIEFSSREVTVNPLRINSDILQELLASLVLIDTGKSRLSSNILSRQIESYERGDERVMESLHKMKQIAFDMKSALQKGDLARFGKLLGNDWEWKKRLDTMISNPQIESIYQKALEHGAVGGKVLGAGNGGHMLFFVEFARKRELLKCLELEGHPAIGFNFDNQGVVSWRLVEDGILA
jgi:D-glycero-alpha-D-manno-heptose-7-phosphate kinase